jgi:hypothetical protein
MYLFLEGFSVLSIWYLLVQGIYRDKCKGKAVPVRAMKALGGVDV